VVTRARHEGGKLLKNKYLLLASVYEDVGDLPQKDAKRA
jgi:hypothetical protein